MTEDPRSDVRTAEAIDVVGDVHGAYGTLLDLLQVLGYRRVGGRWRHPEARRLLFLGDYIDRGPRSYEVYRLVRSLCEDGMAFALLGNHEVNAIAFSMRSGGGGLDAHGAWNAAMAAIEGRASPQEGWLRDHRLHVGTDEGLPSNLQHHRATLVTTSRGRYSEMLDWFLRLPLWLETDALRAVHAAWIQESIVALRCWSTDMRRRAPGVTCPTFDEAVRECQRRAGIAPEHKHEIAMELMCDRRHGFRYGEQTVAALLFSLVVGIDVPVNPAVPDAEGQLRNRLRVRWYLPAPGATLRERAFMPLAVLGKVPAEAIDRPLVLDGAEPFRPDLASGYGARERPVFFGHYGLRRGDPVAPLAPNVACLDYSGYEDGGELMAYRFEGEPTLSEERMLSVPAREPVHPSHRRVERDEDPRSAGPRSGHPPSESPWSPADVATGDFRTRLIGSESRLLREAARQALRTGDGTST